MNNQYNNSPKTFRNFSEADLREPSEWNRDIRNERNLDPIPYGENIDQGYSNFLNLTLQPQNNPYGASGNVHAMKNLELQLPVRRTTEKNPLKNVNISDYNTDQQYSKASSGCGIQCKKNIYKTIIQSPDDALWERQSSERQFYTTPNSSVPNEQNKFAQWLYGKNFVCKSGSIYDRYGYPYTADSLVCTGNNASSPQNGGQTENNYGTPAMSPQGSFWANDHNVAYGFGGIRGGIPPPNLTMSSPRMFTNPSQIKYK